MASILKHLRSSTADKRPTGSGLADGQIAINTASGTPAMFFKDSNGGVVKVGPAHVGSAAPNVVPAGSSGNSLGELWVDNSLTTPGLKYYTGSAFVNLTPSGTTTTVGLVELATGAETQTGTDAVRAVTPSGLQSKVSDSTSTTSSTTIASSTAVKSAYDLANAALPKAGGTITGELLIGNTGSLVFEGATDNTFETTIAVVDPTADRTITFPDVTGTVVTTGDTGSITSAMIADDTIVNADINSAAAIAYGKLALSSGIINTDISASAAIAHSKLASMTAGQVLIGNASNVPTSTAVTGDVTISSAGVTAIGAGVIVDADINAAAAIAGTKISPNFGAQNITTTGTCTSASFNPTSATLPANGFYLPAANTLALSSNTVERLRLGTAEAVFNEGGEDFNFRVESDTNTHALFVDAALNRVGVLSSAPDFPLDVAGSIGILENNSLTFHNGSGSASYQIYGANSDELRFERGSGLTRALTIDAAGRLVVTATSTRSTFQPTGVFAPHLQVEGTTSDDAAMSLIMNAGTNLFNCPSINFGRTNGTTLGSTAAVTPGANLGKISFFAANGTRFIEAATINVTSVVAPTASSAMGQIEFFTADLGSPNLAAVIEANGQMDLLVGVNFGVDTLNSYEIGDWLVNFYDAATGGDVSATSTTARYVKIGQTVTISFSVSNINKTGLSGNFYYDLPYTSRTSTVATGACFVGSMVLQPNGVCGYIPAGADRGLLYDYGSNTAWGALTWADLGVGTSDLIISFTYQTEI